MQYVGVAELKNKTANTVEQAQTDVVIVTKHGKPVAVLTSMFSYEAIQVQLQAMAYLVNNPEVAKKFLEDYEKVRRGDLNGFVDFNYDPKDSNE